MLGEFVLLPAASCHGDDFGLLFSPGKGHVVSELFRMHRKSVAESPGYWFGLGLTHRSVRPSVRHLDLSSHISSLLVDGIADCGQNDRPVRHITRRPLRYQVRIDSPVAERAQRLLIYSMARPDVNLDLLYHGLNKTTVSTLTFPRFKIIASLRSIFISVSLCTLDSALRFTQSTGPERNEDPGTMGTSVKLPNPSEKSAPSISVTIQAKR